jgi:hypothetical protein
MKIHVSFYIDLKPREKIEIKVRKEKTNYKKLVLFAAVLGLLINLPMLYAYEAHIINVTAEICNYSETRTMGYWKNHPESFLQCGIGTVNLGEDTFDLTKPEDVQNLLYVFGNVNAQDMVNMLKGQLLAMKFNIACFGIGDYFFEDNKFPGVTGTLNDFVEQADNLIIAHTQGDKTDREAMEETKDILDYVNNMHDLKYCSETPAGFEPMLNNYISPLRLNRIMDYLNGEDAENTDNILETQTSSDEESFSIIDVQTQSDSETFNMIQTETDSGKDAFDKKDNNGKKDNPPGKEKDQTSVIQTETDSTGETFETVL